MQEVWMIFNTKCKQTSTFCFYEDKKFVFPLNSHAFFGGSYSCRSATFTAGVLALIMHWWGILKKAIITRTRAGAFYRPTLRGPSQCFVTLAILSSFDFFCLHSYTLQIKLSRNDYLMMKHFRVFLFRLNPLISFFMLNLKKKTLNKFHSFLSIMLKVLRFKF